MFVRLLILIAAAMHLTVAHAEQPSLEADGTQIMVRLADGRIVRSPQLIGASLMIATGQSGAIRVRLDAVEHDPDDRTGQVWLHSFSAQDGQGNWQPMCSPGPDGRQQGFPLAGHANADGSVSAGAPGEMEVVCTSGARGKCVRFGYHPWERTSDGRSMLELYNACIRMVRADYGGNGHPYTRNGMKIDLYDDHQIQQLDKTDAMPFEAGWTAAGAVCVAHPRVPENGTLSDIAAANPRLDQRTGPAICTEEQARALGAVLFNRSESHL